MSKATIEILARALDRSLKEADDLRRSISQQQAYYEAELDMVRSAPRPRMDSDVAAREIAEIANQRKISAIKMHRTLCGGRLKEAKDAVERYWPKEQGK